MEGIALRYAGVTVAKFLSSVVKRINVNVIGERRDLPFRDVILYTDHFHCVPNVYTLKKKESEKKTCSR